VENNPDKLQMPAVRCKKVNKKIAKQKTLCMLCKKKKIQIIIVPNNNK
jgi:hypothetical protein